MATVWELITDSSTLPEDNIFWDHLNNLGNGISTSVILLDGLEVEMGCPEYDIIIDLYGKEVEISPDMEFEVELDSIEYEVEVCDG